MKKIQEGHKSAAVQGKPYPTVSLAEFIIDVAGWQTSPTKKMLIKKDAKRKRRPGAALANAR